MALTELSTGGARFVRAGKMKTFAVFGIMCLWAASIASAQSLPTKVAGISFSTFEDFSVSVVLYDEKGYHYSDGKSTTRSMNVFYVPKAIPFDGDIFDSAELQRSERELKAGKSGKAFSIFGATRISAFRNVVVLDSLKVNEFESQNISFERSTFLSDDKYYYVISFHEDESEFRQALISQNQELFIFKEKTGPSWNSEKLAQLYRSFSTRKAMPSHIEDLNRLIDKIMNTVEFVRR